MRLAHCNQYMQMVVLLAILLNEYKVELRNPEEYDGLTVLEKRAKLLRSRTFITMG